MKELNKVEVQDVNGGIVFTTVIAVCIVVDMVLIGVMVGMQQEMAKK